MVDAPPPPPCALPPDVRVKLRVALPCGGTKGAWAVAPPDFREAWTTAFVTVQGVPPDLVCRAHDLVDYVAALHALLVRAYAAEGLDLPRWRSWAALHRRWPWLASSAAPPPPRRRTHVLRPLPEFFAGVA